MLEAAIAMLLVAMVGGTMFSMAFSIKSSQARNERRLVAEQLAQAMNDQLKNFVSADLSVGGWVPGLLGPNSDYNVSPAYGWYMTDWWKVYDSCAACPAPPTAPGAADCYALAAGGHCVTGDIVPGWFSAAPYYGRIGYTVTNTITGQTAGAAGNPCGSRTECAPRVDVNVTWVEP